MITLEYFISILAPHHCLVCGHSPSPLCDICSQTMMPAPKCCYKCGKEAFDGLCITCRQTSYIQRIEVRTIYRGHAIEALKGLKFKRIRGLAPVLAKAMKPICPTGLLVPIPTAPRRQRQRGYDQAELIARYLARYTGQRYKPMLRRRGATRQLGQNRIIRQQQLTDAYYLTGANITPHHQPLVLIDDVMTTGATIEAAAATLHRAGYTQLYACLFAWSPPGKPDIAL